MTWDARKRMPCPAPRALFPKARPPPCRKGGLAPEVIHGWILERGLDTSADKLASCDDSTGGGRVGWGREGNQQVRNVRSAVQWRQIK